MLEIIENILPEQDEKYLSYNKLIPLQFHACPFHEAH